ncbi:MAG: acetyl-CoA carboxylase, biotin carboxyl carrier protein [Planctomycetes bacterium RBG_13_62_9]|nr:MAG: acetyl-CoA carboxylase, biotin carboxyl carrier protein [Planctomycetes bacterium RBG_13_62_9]
MPEKDADVQKIKELIRIMKENDLVKIDIQHGEDRISLQRAEPQPPVAPAQLVAALPAPAMPVAASGTQAVSAGPQPPTSPEGTVEIKSPIVGTFYEAPSPDSDLYVEVGSHVDPQTVVCIVEAMKVMNEIKAEISGTVVEKLVKTGQAVEYGQPLFRVRPE